MQDIDDTVFRSSNYRGPRPAREDDDPLAGELMNCKDSSSDKDKNKDLTKYVISKEVECVIKFIIFSILIY